MGHPWLAQGDYCHLQGGYEYQAPNRLCIRYTHQLVTILACCRHLLCVLHQ